MNLLEKARVNVLREAAADEIVQPLHEFRVVRPLHTGFPEGLGVFVLRDGDDSLRPLARVDRTEDPEVLCAELHDQWLPGLELFQVGVARRGNFGSIEGYERAPRIAPVGSDQRR